MLIPLLLFLAGVLGGAVNAIAGGATLFTFPAMLMAGLPPVAANASNAVALVPGHLLAAIADREKLPTMDGRFMFALMACVAGGAAGALIALLIPERWFALPVPALIGAATLLFALAPRLAAWAARRRTGEAAGGAGFAVLVPTAIYGGFFGAGLGILLTAVLALIEPADIRKVKVLKNLLATAVSLAAVMMFICQGAVAWTSTLPMLGGALLGGYLGGHLIRILPGEAVRRAVIAAGLLMTVVYARLYWF